MKRKLLLIVTLIAFRFITQAQPFGNEWIDYSQTHYKIKVTADGMYRIPFATLSSIPNISSINVNNFVMYHNGQAVPIYISSSTTLGSSDYIDFYGQKNIGDVDSMLYKSSAMQPHIYYSLFNDTSVYYLTVKTTGANPRFTPLINNISNVPPKETYFIATTRQIYTAANTQGEYYLVGNDEIFKSIYDVGEGYRDQNFFGNFGYSSTNQFSNLTYTLSTPFLNPNGPAATFYSVYCNNSPTPDVHTVSISLNASNIYNQSPGVNGFHLGKINVPVQNNLLNSGNNAISYTETGNLNSFQQDAVYMNQIDYAHYFDFNAQTKYYFKIAGDAVNKKYIEITNFNSNHLQPILYDMTNRLVIQSTVPINADTLKFSLPPSSTTRELYLVSGDPSSYNTVTKLSPIVFQNYTSSAYQADYLIISDSVLYHDVDNNGYDEVTDYKRYRDQNDNPGVGKYHARVFDIDQLYDQFAFGVRKSPLAVRNFIQYAVNKWQAKYAFIIGKGREYPDIRSSASAYAQCLVPTFGQPGSDNLLAATRTSDVPTIGIGRLAAQNAQQVHDYLAKMKAYENVQNTYPANQDVPPKIWQKQVLHFSGGTNFSEQILFQYYLNTYKKIVADTLWGAHVTAYSKTSSDPISQAQAQVIESQIDSGVSLITFFGHAATGAFDFSIDEPENYTNLNKYPVIISNGCFSGLIFDPAPGYSERFVLEANKGAIAFMATSDLSVSSGLDHFSSDLYHNFAVNKYNLPFGSCIKQTLTDLFTNAADTADIYTMAACYEMTLHGDPALNLNTYPKPDYALTANGSSVYFTPSPVTPGVDSFKVNVIVTNLGKAINKNITVRLQRTVFDQNNNNHPIIFTYNQVVPAPYFIDTVTFTLPTTISALGYGQNLFSPYVDADFEVDEMAELNNGLSTPVSLNIQSDDVVPIYPYAFAIDSDKSVTLKASTTNPFATLRKYDFQIDTTNLFNSPLLQAGSVTQTGGVLHWTPTLIYKDSVVYYWRVKIDTSAGWRYSSFEHINGQYGWNQSHFYQFTQDNYLNLKLDSTTRMFKFPSTVNNVQVLTGWTTAVGGNIDFETMGWNYNNSNMYRFRMGGCGFLSGITFAVIDSVTGLPWVSLNNDQDNYGDTYGNYHCSDKESFQYGFDFLTTGTHGAGNGAHSWSGQSWSNVVKNFINSIPCGAYVLIYSDNKVPYSSWDTTLINTLQSIGFQAQLFKSGSINGPFIFFTQKCNVGYPVTFNHQQGYAGPIQSSINFQGTWYQGQVSSPVIGPAVQWNRMQWRKHAIENPTADKDSVDLIGITTAGSSAFLRTTTLFDNSIQNISATQYPYLQLRLRTEDDSLRTPTQLNYWRVLYQKPAEAVINPAAHFVMTPSLTLGGTFHFEIALENVTKIKMDSMLVKYNVRDAAFNNYTYNIRNSPLLPLDTLILKFNSNLNSNSYQGLNQLSLEANPNNDQPEQYHFNNYAMVNFSAAGDSTNPLLDITFDGQHIFNNDIVSAKPDILITLKDENKFLALNDTSVLSVYVLAPGSTTPVKANFDNQILKFYPADSNNLTHNNKAQIDYKPTFNVDGTYQLLIKDKDRSGNHSSNEDRNIDNTYFDYKIDFQVVNKPMITNVLNYPNPFTTSTHFVFTITGSEVPDYMKIQIMTIRGIVVKEISKDELGPLRIGQNITTYAWDGRDQYGNTLANGVYFYRVVTRLDNKKMDNMSMSYDKYFKKGFGKMVIVR